MVGSFFHPQPGDRHAVVTGTNLVRVGDITMNNLK
jgi:hypothetical protein